MLNFVKIGQIAAEIWQFFDFARWRAPSSLIFKTLKLLTVERLERAELRRRAKFGRNRSNCGRDMAIFRFFKMAAAAILDFQNLKLLTVERLERPNCVAMPNFVEIGQTVAEIY